MQQIRYRCFFSSIAGRITTKPVKELTSSYHPERVEEGWYEWWEQCGFFQPLPDQQQPYRILTPPPNVTGSLHIGHALNYTLQDSLGRWKRMQGFGVCLIPGTDHAGISTQAKIEKLGLLPTSSSGQSSSRESALEVAKQWSFEQTQQITSQIRSLGISVDWTRQYFTLDLSAPQIAFVRLAEEGRIYRRARPINWCGYLKTAISDIEVERVEIAGSSLLALPGREKKVQVGLLHRIAYAVVDQPGEEILVDTTRIETLPGDEAIAVNPNDERYKKWHGAMLQHPLLPFKRIPVIVDDWVDPEFGTGACKVTPAHDFDDFNLGLRHSLPLDRTIWDEAGRFINNCGIPLLQGKDRFEARPQIVELLKDAYRGHQSHQMVLALCARSGDLLEPRIMPQWYLKMSDLAQAALGLVEQGKLKLVGGGGGYEQEWERWMSNVQDWCISRQLWWGHQIPAWRTEKGDWVFATNQQEALEKAQYLYGSCGQVEQDLDVMDTWFSSALLPLSAQGWNGADSLEIPKGYPLDLLVTGSDIIFFWVARMAMLCGNFTSCTTPFKKVLFNPMVRDGVGRKMSKSLGNVINPTDVMRGRSLAQLRRDLESSQLSKSEIERYFFYYERIPAHGTDALRLALLSLTTQQAQSINLDLNVPTSALHFCNKLWNLTKFALQFKGQVRKDMEAEGGLAEKFILSRLHQALIRLNGSFEEFRFSQVTETLRGLIHHDLADVYVELVKPDLYNGGNSSVLLLVLEASLRALHPVMPFITEELWQHLSPSSPTSSIMMASYPLAQDYPYLDLKAEKEVQELLDLQRLIRSLRQQLSFSSHTSSLLISCDSEKVEKGLKSKLGRRILDLAKCDHEWSIGQADVSVAWGYQGEQVRVSLVNAASDGSAERVKERLMKKQQKQQLLREKVASDVRALEGRKGLGEGDLKRLQKMRDYLNFIAKEE